MSTQPRSLRNADHTERLRTVGLRATAPRLAILAELEGDDRHPSAEMLHETLQDIHPKLALSTIYATLETFVQKGLVRRVTGNSSKLRVDGQQHEHDHAVCRCCGEVFDVPRQNQALASPPALPAGLHLQRMHIEYEVVCNTCAKVHGTSACP